MILKNIIVHTIAYGSEIFGCNEARVKKLKGVVDAAIKCILKKKQFCKSKSL